MEEGNRKRKREEKEEQKGDNGDSVPTEKEEEGDEIQSVDALVARWQEQPKDEQLARIDFAWESSSTSLQTCLETYGSKATLWDGCSLEQANEQLVKVLTDAKSHPSNSETAVYLWFAMHLGTAAKTVLDVRALHSQVEEFREQLGAFSRALKHIEEENVSQMKMQFTIVQDAYLSGTVQADRLQRSVNIFALHLSLAQSRLKFVVSGLQELAAAVQKQLDRSKTTASLVKSAAGVAVPLAIALAAGNVHPLLLGLIGVGGVVTVGAHLVSYFRSQQYSELMDRLRSTQRDAARLSYDLRTLEKGFKDMVGLATKRR